MANKDDSTADKCIIWKNCAIDDTSMKFGTQLGSAFTNIYGYRDIADSSCDKNGSHFPKWPPKMYLTVLSSCVSDFLGILDHGRYNRNG